DLGVPGGLHGRTSLIPVGLAKVFQQSPNRKEPLTVGLIRLLEKENAVNRAARAGQTDVTSNDDYQGYFGDLIAAVGSLHDRRAVGALAENIATGNLATKAL